MGVLVDSRPFLLLLDLRREILHMVSPAPWIKMSRPGSCLAAAYRPLRFASLLLWDAGASWRGNSSLVAGSTAGLAVSTVLSRARRARARAARALAPASVRARAPASVCLPACLLPEALIFDGSGCLHSVVSTVLSLH